MKKIIKSRRLKEAVFFSFFLLVFAVITFLQFRSGSFVDYTNSAPEVGIGGGPPPSFTPFK